MGRKDSGEETGEKYLGGMRGETVKELMIWRKERDTDTDTQRQRQTDLDEERIPGGPNP